MKFVILLLLCSSSLLCLGQQSRKSYNGYQVIRTIPLDENSMKKLYSLYHNPEYDFWFEPHLGRPADIMTSPDHATQLWNELTLLGLQPSVLISNVEELINNQQNEIKIKKNLKNSIEKAPSFDRYMDLNEIESYLDEIVASYPSFASLEVVGQSHEGRPLRLLKLSNGPGKTGLFFEAGMHAREWAGPTLALFIINELTENLANNQAMLDKNDFYFLPVTNPDGYVYTWDVDRFWRKNRNSNNGSICRGADPNRNFDYNWGGGGVPISCDLMYPGSEPFSEAESSAIANYLLANPTITFYTAIHSYGSYILYPYGDTFDLPPTIDELRRVSEEASTAIASVRGTRYHIGTTAEILYFAYGQCDDWVYDVAGVSFSYTIELPGGGIGGFDPPAEEILPMVTETWEAIKVFAANTPASR